MPSFDTHTWGHQHVVIDSEQGRYVATGDAVFSFGNLEGIDEPGVYVPIGQAIGSQERVLEVFDEIVNTLSWRRRPHRPVSRLRSVRAFPVCGDT